MLVLDCRRFGGQAGASARIENYLGFPTGISGMALMARAYNQAQKFGVEIAIPSEVIGFDGADRTSPSFALRLASGERVSARAVVIASGARYRRLDVENLADVRRRRAFIIGPRRSRRAVRRPRGRAGRRRQFGRPGGGLSRRAGREGLDAGARREPRRDHVALSGRPDQRTCQCRSADRTEVCALEGADGMLSAVHWRHTRPARKCAVPIRHLFLFIGADPNTGWLSGAGVALDRKASC